ASSPLAPPPCCFPRRRATPCWRRDSAGCTSGSASGLRGGTVAKSNAARRAGPGGPAPLKGEAGGGAAPALDKLIHERLRLAIVSALAANDALTFSELKAVLKTSDGNLSVH